MDLSVLTPKQRDNVNKVLEYRKSHPDVALMTAYKNLGIHASTMNSASRRLGCKGMREFVTKWESGDTAQVVTYKDETPTTRTYNKKAKTNSVGGNAYVVIIPRGELAQTLNELMKG